MRFRRLIPAVLVAASLLVPPAQAQVQVHALILAFEYIPGPVTALGIAEVPAGTIPVLSGDTVVWHDLDPDAVLGPHTATADDGSFDTGIMLVGGQGSATISAPAGAVIGYGCLFHPWMRGSITVVA